MVGGGAVGTRKTAGLVDCGARVTVVSPAFSARLQEMAATGNPRLRRRGFRSGDLDGMFLVMGATDDEALNTRIHREAEARGMLCNIADRPAVCNFILPAVVRRGDLLLAVSTSGRSPAFARRLRMQLENQFGPEYGEFLALMGAIRRRLLAAEHAPEAHKPLFEALIDGGLLELLANRRRPQIDALLERVLGPGFTLDRLTFEPQDPEEA